MWESENSVTSKLCGSQRTLLLASCVRVRKLACCVGITVKGLMTDSLCSAVSGLLGALTSERNVVGIASSTILPLAKRALIKELHVLNSAKEIESDEREFEEAL